jgi:hypothetical protein
MPQTLIGLLSSDEIFDKNSKLDNVSVEGCIGNCNVF